MGADASRTLVERAVRGVDEALRELVDRLTPVVQARVARRLLLSGTAGDASRVRQEVEDLVQEVFLVLFADDARVLRGWDPERGLSLENYVGLVAERRAVSLLRTVKRNPLRQRPTPAEELDGASAQPGPERSATSRDRLRRLLGRLREELTPVGWHLFDLLYVQELSVADVEAATSLSRDAVYAWRSRLRRRARELLDENVSDPGPGRRKNEGRSDA